MIVVGEIVFVVVGRFDIGIKCGGVELEGFLSGSTKVEFIVCVPDREGEGEEVLDMRWSKGSREIR